MRRVEQRPKTSTTAMCELTTHLPMPHYHLPALPPPHPANATNICRASSFQTMKATERHPRRPSLPTYPDDANTYADGFSLNGGGSKYCSPMIWASSASSKNLRPKSRCPLSKASCASPQKTNTSANSPWHTSAYRTTLAGSKARDR